MCIFQPVYHICGHVCDYRPKLGGRCQPSLNAFKPCQWNSNSVIEHANVKVIEYCCRHEHCVHGPRLEAAALAAIAGARQWRDWQGMVHWGPANPSGIV